VKGLTNTSARRERCGYTGRADGTIPLSGVNIVKVDLCRSQAQSVHSVSAWERFYRDTSDTSRSPFVEEIGKG
jgi:hypothetical protein